MTEPMTCMCSNTMFEIEPDEFVCCSCESRAYINFGYIKFVPGKKVFI